MLETIFQRISSLGSVTVLPQELQLSQVRGECEQSAYSAALNYILKDDQNNLAHLMQKMTNDLSIDLAESIISLNKRNVSLMTTNSLTKIIKIESTMKNDLKAERDRKLKEIEELQDQTDKVVLPLRNEMMALERSIAGVKQVNSLMKVPDP